MGGGLMQLVAYGAQDVYLTGNPQITFFKVVYRRHTNFAVEAIEQTFNGSVGFGKRVSCQITRNGDLITKMYLKATLTADTLSVDTDAWVDNLGYSMIKSVELQIGGTKIDKHYGVWMNIWHELSSNHAHDDSYTNMLGRTNNTETSQTLYVPLQFFCCRNDGLALPLIALQYHDVRVEFEFAAVSDCHVGDPDKFNGHSLDDASLLVDYIYLDSEERKRFAQASHEYLIEQLQYTGAESISGTSGKYRLNFNHPCKELVWVTTDCAEDKSVSKANNFGNATTKAAGANPVKTAQLQLNGHDRMSIQSGKYFNHVQASAHHSNSPSEGVNVYSFALNPEEHQPSGTCNFSRIDNAQLNIEFEEDYCANGKVHVFATSYNVLRIMSGMGGLAYSN
jgi:hypothetical protein